MTIDLARDVSNREFSCPVQVRHRVNLHGQELRFLGFDLLEERFKHLIVVHIEVFRPQWVPYHAHRAGLIVKARASEGQFFGDDVVREEEAAVGMPVLVLAVSEHSHFVLLADLVTLCLVLVIIKLQIYLFSVECECQRQG